LNGNQTLTPNTNVQVGTDNNKTESEMQIAINPANPLNVVGFTHNVAEFHEIQLFYSMDGGTTWTRRLITNAGGAGQINDTFGAGSRVEPTITFDSGGHLFVGYLLRPDDGTDRVVVGQSNDGGNTFPTFYTVENVAAGDELDAPQLATGPSGPGAALNTQAVYVAYIRISGEDYRVGVSGLRVGVDANFKDPQNVDDVGGGALNINAMPRVAVGPAGQVYVAWHNFTNPDPVGGPVGRVMFDRDLTGLWAPGNSFGVDVVVRNLDYSLWMYQTPATNRRGISTDAVLAVDRSGGPRNGRVYIAYTDNPLKILRPNDTDIYLLWSDNQGTAWNPNLAAGALGNVEAAASTDFEPWLAVDQNTGSVNVAYYTTNDAPNDTEVDYRLASSTDGGNTFTKVDLTSQRSRAQSADYARDFLEYNGLAVLNGTFQGFWADNRGAMQGQFVGTLHAYTASASTFNANNTLAITGDDGGVITSDVITVRNSPANANFVEVLVNGTRQFAGLWASIGRITINGGRGTDTINVQNVPANIALTITNAAGNDTINLGSTNGADSQLTGIQGPLTVNGQGGTNTLNLNDQGWGLGIYTITSSTVRASGAGLITYAGIQNLNVNCGGPRGTSVNVQSTANWTNTTVNSGAGPGTINVGNAANRLDDIQGPLTVNGQGGTSTLNVTDQGSNTGKTYTLTPAQVSRTGGPVINYASIQTLVLNAANVGGNGNSITVNQTPAGATVTVQGGGTGTSITVNGTGANSNTTVRGGPGGGNTITINGTGANSRTTADAGAGGRNSINVWGNGGGGSVTLVLLGGGGGMGPFPLSQNVITVGSATNTLDSIVSPVIVTGGGGGDSLIVNDQGSSASQTYTLGVSTIDRSGVGEITYSGIGSLTLNPSSGNDTIDVTGLAGGTQLTLDGGPGYDSVVLMSGTLTDPVLLGVGQLQIVGGTLSLSTTLSVLDYLQSGGTLTGSGTVTATNSANWTGGTMSGLGTTSVAATATLSLGSGVLTLIDRTLLNNGTATWTNGSIVGGTGTLSNSGTLSGSGTLTDNLVNNGQLFPGGAGVVGSITVNGNYSQGGVLSSDLHTPTNSDLLIVSGAITLGGPLNLDTLPGFTGNSFTILQNTSTNPINGIFEGLPEGASVTLAGQMFTISYVGGTGHDVVLSLQGTGGSVVLAYNVPGFAVAALTVARVRLIITGGDTNWSQLGGPNLPIYFIYRLDFDPTTAFVNAWTQTYCGFSVPPFPVGVGQVGANRVINLVAAYPGSIGYVYDTLDQGAGLPYVSFPTGFGPGGAG
jgi:hypothetical protein